MEGKESLRADLGVRATVVFDHHTGAPRTADDQTKEDWPDFGIGYLDDIDLVSIWSFEVALYALQNPTSENIKRALTLIAQSGDCDEWLDEETLEVLPVFEPNGWSEA